MHRSPGTFAALLVLLLATSGSAMGQSRPHRTVSGIVRDSATGETLPFVLVRLEATAAQTYTNRDGFFVLGAVPLGSSLVRVTTVGFRAQVVTIPAGREDVALAVVLAPVSLVLDPVNVEVEEQRLLVADEGVSRVTISPRDLAVLPSIGEIDIFRGLQLMPGVSATHESSSGLYVRGGTPDQNLVLLDGMTVYHVDHFFGFFSAFNAEAIKDVQFHKGGFPAQYGGRVSSVVDLTGKEGDVARPHMAMSANLLSAQATAQTPLGPRATVLLAARRSYTDLIRTGLYSQIFGLFDDNTAQPAGPAMGPGAFGPGGMFGNAARQTTVPAFYFYDLNAKLTYRPSQRDVVSLSYYGGQDNLDESRSNDQQITGQGGGFDRQVQNAVTDLTNWGNRGVSLRWGRQWTSRLYSNLLVATSEYRSDALRSTLLEERDAGTDTLVGARTTGSAEANLVSDRTLRLDNEWQVLGSHRLQFGTWLQRAGARYLSTRDDTTTVLDRDDHASQLAGYVQDAWAVAPWLGLTVGGRATAYSGTGQTYWEPRVSTRLSLSPSVALKAAYGRYHQFVSRVVNENVVEGSRDFWLLADGDLVDVTSSVHYVLGGSVETRSLLFDVEFYRKDLSGLSEFSLRYRRAGEADPLNLFFQGTGVVRGMDVLIQRKIGVFTGWASYALSRVEHTFPALNGGLPFPPLHDQRHEFKLVGSAALGRWRLAGTWAYGSGTPYTAPQAEYTVTLLDGTEETYIHVGGKNSQRLPSYQRLDLAATYHLRLGSWNAELGVSVFNVLNHTNVWYREFDLSQSPLLVTDVTYLGFTPTVSVRLGL